MTRNDQVEAVARVAGITPQQARLALDAIYTTITLALVRDGRMSLTGVGTFTVQVRRPRRVMNPSTRVIMDLPASSVVKFKPAPGLRKSVEEAHSPAPSTDKEQG